MTEKRFEIIKDCNNTTVLIDKHNKLPTIPIAVNYDTLSDEDWEMLNRWLRYLNGDVE